MGVRQKGGECRRQTPENKTEGSHGDKKKKGEEDEEEETSQAEEDDRLV